jgi:colanic acid biosynthesis glycosyl transferase WcaI
MPSALIISPFFFPEQISTGKYNTVLAQALRERGYDVTVLCSHPFYPRWKPQQPADELPGIRTIRGGGWIRYPRSIILRRVVLELWFAWHIARHALRFRKETNLVIIVVFPPSLFFTVATKLFCKRARRIGIVHDLQAVHAATSSLSVVKNGLSQVIQLIERHAFGACDRLIALSKSMAAHMIAGDYASAEKIKVCYPFSTLDCNKRQGESLVRVLPQYRLHVVYAGALGEKQNPAGLLAFLEEAAQRLSSSCQFHIFSEGPNFEKLRDTGARGGMTNISFHGLVPEEQLEELYLRSTVQILPQAKGTEAGSMPSKLPNIIASSRPVFAICDKASELGRLVEEFDLGIVASVWEPEFLANRLKFFVDKEICEWNKRSRSPRRLMVAEMFSLGRLVREVLE